ncbi:MAG: 6-carboxytetrahydropterin synthase [Caldilineaceae bacterium]
MYTLAVRRDFVAQHFLIGGDWGPENQWHSHHYVLELQLEGDTLDRHGYLVDIVNVEAALEEVVAHYKEQDPQRAARVCRPQPQHRALFPLSSAGNWPTACAPTT